jgi:hypothetical protein
MRPGGAASGRGNQAPKPVFMRRMILQIRLREPLQVSEMVEVADAKPPSPIAGAMSATLGAYRKAALGSLNGQFATVRHLV